jgi:hypothetical protein
MCLLSSAAAGLEPVYASDIEVQLTPLNEIFDSADAVGFELTLTNHSTVPVQFETSRTNSSNTTTVPKKIKLELRRDTVEVRQTDVISVRLAEPADCTKTPTFTSVVVPTEIAAGEAYKTQIYLETAPTRRLVREDIAGTYTARAIVPGHMLEAEGRLLLVPTRMKPGASSTSIIVQPDGNFNLQSDPTSITVVAATAGDGRRDYYNSPAWWGWTRLNLMGDGRFVYRTFSDMGGERPPVKGYYSETSNTITLHPIVNCDSPGFYDRRVWNKVQYEDWLLLVPLTTDHGNDFEKLKRIALWPIEPAAKPRLPYMKPVAAP